MSGRNAWVSYHALALQLTVYPSRLSKISSRERFPLRIDAAIPAAVPCGPQRASRADTRVMELMGIEPTTSGLQNRRSPS